MQVQGKPCFLFRFTGLEDLGTLLYERGFSMQEFITSINEKALQKLYDYYKKFRAFHLDRSKLPRDTEARAVLIDRVNINTKLNYDVVPRFYTN